MAPKVFQKIGIDRVKRNAYNDIKSYKMEKQKRKTMHSGKNNIHFP